MRTAGLLRSLSRTETIRSIQRQQESIGAYTMTKTILPFSVEESRQDDAIDRFFDLIRYEIAFDHWHSGDYTENYPYNGECFNAVNILICAAETEATAHLVWYVHDHRN